MKTHTRLGLALAFLCTIGFMLVTVSCTDITTTAPDGTVTRTRRPDIEALTLGADSAVKLGQLVQDFPPSGK